MLIMMMLLLLICMYVCVCVFKLLLFCFLFLIRNKEICKPNTAGEKETNSNALQWKFKNKSSQEEIFIF